MHLDAYVFLRPVFFKICLKHALSCNVISCIWESLADSSIISMFYKEIYQAVSASCLPISQTDDGMYSGNNGSI